MDLIYFLLIMVVFFLAYGIPQQAILYPNEGPSWSMASRVFFRPYFQAHGELFLDAPDISKRFVFNRWIPSDGYNFVNMYSKIDVLSSVIVRGYISSTENLSYLARFFLCLNLIFDKDILYARNVLHLCLGALMSLWVCGPTVSGFMCIWVWLW